MKFSVSNLLDQNSKDSAVNNTQSTTFSMSGLGNLQSQNPTTSNSVTTFTNSTENTATSEEPTFSLTFTNDEVYNLDDIVFKKRRDNADCPLIVHVKDDDPIDEAVIAQITKLILSDYGIGYNDTNYKTQISYVPLFESVFTNYFNTYYEIYHKKRTKVNEGSISLTSILEEIVAYHESLVNGFVGESARTYANSDSYNKPKVEWEYGTVFDNALAEDVNSFLPSVVNLFSLKVINDKLYITYDNVPIPDSGIDFDFLPNSGGNTTPDTPTESNDSRIESTTMFVHYPVDVAIFDVFTPVRIVQFRKLIKNLFTATTTTFGNGVGE